MTEDQKTARAIATDLEIEQGVLPIGEEIHCTTATFAYRGILIAATPSYYVLQDPVLVGNAGSFGDYLSKKGFKGEEESEKCEGAQVLIERSANTAIWRKAKS